MVTINNRNWQVIDQYSELQNLECDWRQLFASNPRHSPFQAWGWVTSWIKHLAGPHELKFICWRNDQDELSFVLPLVGRPQSKEGKCSEYFAACGYGPECSDHIGCLRHPERDEHLTEITALALEQLVDNGVRVNLASQDGTDDFPENLRTKLKEMGIPVRLDQDHRCPSIRLPGSWEEFLKSLSSNFRSQIRRYYRNIANHETVSFRSVEPSGATDFANELIRLNRSRMANKGMESSLEDPGFRAFILEAIPSMAKDGLAWMDVIANGEIIVGAALNLVHADRVYYYMGGFDEGSGNLRPGKALFAEVIKRSIDLGHKSYDFLRGAEPYKYRWGASDTITWRLIVYPKTLFRGKIASHKDSLILTTRMAVRRFRDKHKKQ